MRAVTVETVYIEQFIHEIMFFVVVVVQCLTVIVFNAFILFSERVIEHDVLSSDYIDHLWCSERHPAIKEDAKVNALCWNVNRSYQNRGIMPYLFRKPVCWCTINQFKGRVYWRRRSGNAGRLRTIRSLNRVPLFFQFK